MRTAPRTLRLRCDPDPQGPWLPRLRGSRVDPAPLPAPAPRHCCRLAPPELVLFSLGFMRLCVVVWWCGGVVLAGPGGGVGGGVAGVAGVQELEDMKRRLKEMEDEAAALREMQARVEKEMGAVPGAPVVRRVL